MFKKLLFAAALCAFAALPTRAQNQSQSKPDRPALTFRNPLKIQGADPWMTYYKGYYYLSTTSGRSVSVRKARRIGDLINSPDILIWKDETPGRAVGLWAPEIHLLDDGTGPKWYLYFTAAKPEDDASHRLFVAQSAGTDPLGPYTYKGQLLTDPDDAFYAIDPTILKLADGTLYLAWCGRPSTTGQGIYIAKMSNPWTVTGPRTYLECSGFGNPVVREAPEILQRNGKIFLVYSMCNAATPDYRLGMLVADEKSNLLDAGSWKQYPKIMFARVDQRGVYGPGHNFFFKSPNGKEDWIVYHAKTSDKETFNDRTARAQKITWDKDGTPNFGLPLATDEDVRVPRGEK